MNDLTVYAGAYKKDVAAAGTSLDKEFCFPVVIVYEIGARFSRHFGLTRQCLEVPLCV